MIRTAAINIASDVRVRRGGGWNLSWQDLAHHQLDRYIHTRLKFAPRPECSGSIPSRSIGRMLRAPIGIRNSNIWHDVNIGVLAETELSDNAEGKMWTLHYSNVGLAISPLSCASPPSFS